MNPSAPLISRPTFRSPHFLAKAPVAPLAARAVVWHADLSAATTDEDVMLAGELAERLGAPLVLTHAVDLPRPLFDDRRAVRWVVASRQRTLRAVAAPLRQRRGKVVESVQVGPAAEVLAQAAARDDARLIVVAQPPGAARESARLKTIARQTIGRADAPTLVLRDAGVLRAWLQGRRALRVFVCFDFTAPAEAALHWAARLADLGPIDLTLGYANSPAADHARVGADGPVPLRDNAPVVRACLQRELAARARAVVGAPAASCRVQPRWGRSELHLAQMAEAEGADLVVTGTRRLPRWRRWFRRSVAQGLLESASANVVVVPTAPEAAASFSRVPVLRHVLVATDFSAAGNRAVAHAMGLLRGTGLLTLVHVHPAVPSIHGRAFTDRDWGAMLPASRRRLLTSRLRGVAAAAVGEGDVATQVELLVAADAGRAIAQAAERAGADVICLARRERSGLARRLFGSVTGSLLAHTRRPVHFVPGSA